MKDTILVVDTARCTGCHTCSIACKDRAGLPDELDWLRVEEHETGICPETTLSFRVIRCFHCEAPPCVEICPSQAIARDERGFVVLDREKCTGCGECIDACPFEAIVLQPDGVASKCDGCVDEMAEGREPTCVRACPMRALSCTLREKAQVEGRVTDFDFDDHGIGPAVRFLRRPDTRPPGGEKERT